MTRKIFAIITYPWKRYNQFFDKGSSGIWGLSPILKYTFLCFFLFFIPVLLGWINFTEGTTSGDIFFSLYGIGIIVIVFTWLIYVPILCFIFVIRIIKKVRIFFKKDAKKLYLSFSNISLFWLRQFQTYITAYFPFSEISKGSIFHHKNKEAEKLLGFVWFTASKLKIKITLLDFEVTQHFAKVVIVMMYKKGKEAKNEKLFQKIIDKYGEENTFIDNYDGDEGIKLIRVNRAYFLDSETTKQ